MIEERGRRELSDPQVRLVLCPIEDFALSPSTALTQSHPAHAASAENCAFVAADGVALGGVAPTVLFREFLVVGPYDFDGFMFVMPALRLRSGQALAGIQARQVQAARYSPWIPAPLENRGQVSRE